MKFDTKIHVTTYYFFNFDPIFQITPTLPHPKQIQKYKIRLTCQFFLQKYYKQPSFFFYQ